MTIELGCTVKEKITGVEGRVVGITAWETGCDHIGVKRLGTDKDDKPYDMIWFDAPMCDVLIPYLSSTIQLNPAKKPGGPVPNGR